MKEYKHQGETFQLDDSKGCYVAVTYKHLTGYVGVNLGGKASPKNPYAWYTAREIGGADCVTPDGMKFGIVDPKGASFQAHLDALCAQLLSDFRTEEAGLKLDALMRRASEMKPIRRRWPRWSTRSTASPSPCGGGLRQLVLVEVHGTHHRTAGLAGMNLLA